MIVKKSLKCSFTSTTHENFKTRSFPFQGVVTTRQNILMLYTSEYFDVLFDTVFRAILIFFSNFFFKSETRQSKQTVMFMNKQDFYHVLCKLTLKSKTGQEKTNIYVCE